MAEARLAVRRLGFLPICSLNLTHADQADAGLLRLFLVRRFVLRTPLCPPQVFLPFLAFLLHRFPALVLLEQRFLGLVFFQRASRAFFLIIRHGLHCVKNSLATPILLLAFFRAVAHLFLASFIPTATRFRAAVLSQVEQVGSGYFMQAVYQKRKPGFLRAFL